MGLNGATKTLDSCPVRLVWPDVTFEKTPTVTSRASVSLQSPSLCRVQLCPTQPVAVIWDCMVDLRQLSPSSLLTTVEPIIIPHPINPKRSPFRLYVTQDYYNTFIQRLLTLVKSLGSIADTSPVTVVLVMDKSALSPLEKKQCWEERASAQKKQVKPPSIDYADRLQNRTDLDTIQVNDQGVIWRPGQPVERIHLPEWMSTRQLRPFMFAYFWSKMKTDSRLEGLSVIMDFDHETLHCLRHGQVQTRPQVASLRYGEAEIGALAWSLRLSTTHNIVLYSIDTDVVPLALFHGHRYMFPCVVKAGKRWCHVQSALSSIQKASWTREQLLLILILNGTDFVFRKKILHRIHFKNIVAGVKWALSGLDTIRPSSTSIAGLVCPLTSEKHFIQVLKSIYSLQLGKKMKPIRDAIMDGKDVSLTLLDEQTYRASTTYHWPSEDVLSSEYKRIVFNWTYWATLQETLTDIQKTMGTTMSPEQQNQTLLHLLSR